MLLYVWNKGLYPSLSEGKGRWVDLRCFYSTLVAQLCEYIRKEAICFALWIIDLCTKSLCLVFTFIVHTIMIFYLHSSQKCTTFASNLRQREKSAAIAIKPKNLFNLWRLMYTHWNNKRRILSCVCSLNRAEVLLCPHLIIVSVRMSGHMLGCINNLRKDSFIE